MVFKHICLTKRLLLACITIVVCLFELNAQPLKSDLVTIRAQLRGSFHQNPLPFARVINKTQLWGVLSDTSGIFTIAARPNDTIYISSIGFRPKEIFVTDSLLKQVRIPIIWMAEKIYEMADIDIQSLGNYQQFKYKVLNLKIPQNNIEEAIVSIQRELKKIPKHPVQPEASIPLGSPITALYMMFSKEGKSLKKLAEAKEREKYYGIITPKFNRDIVSQVTGLKGEMLDEFMIFCRPDDLFIVSATEYEIHERILRDYDRFMAVKRNRMGSK